MAIKLIGFAAALAGAECLFPYIYGAFLLFNW